MKKIKIVLCAVLAVATVLSMGGCLRYTSNIMQYAVTQDSSSQTTGYYSNPQAAYTTTPYAYYEATTAAGSEITTAASNVVAESTTAMQVPTTAAGSNAEGATAEVQRDASTWTTAEIVTYINTAVNKTKGYAGAITATHKESTEATVSDCPGGNAVKGIVNKVVSGALEDTNETLNFSGGKATSSEGETLPLLLPKTGAFNLTAAGVAAASASESGSVVTIKIQLVPENGSTSSAPQVHASTVGYLDQNSLDLSSVTITAFDTSYPSTTLEFTVDSTTGYVRTAVYTVPVTINATGKVMGISGTVGVSAKEVESWTINW